MKEAIAVLLSAGLGVTAGWLWGDEVRRWKNAKRRLKTFACTPQPQSIILERCARS